MGQQTHNISLNKIGILILIHHDMAVSGGNFRLCLWNFSKELFPVHQQIVIIHKSIVKFELLIMFFQIFYITHMLREMGITVIDQILKINGFVH